MILKKFFKRNMTSVLIIIILGVLSSIANILSPFAVKWFIDSVLVNGKTSLFYIAFLLIFVSLVFGELLKSLFIYVYSKLSFNLFIDLKNNIFDTLINIPYTDFRKRSNKNLNVFINDIKSVQNTGIETMPDMIISLFIGIGASVYLFYINPIFIAGTLVISIVSLLPLFLISKRQGRMVKEAQTDEQNMTRYIKDTLEKPLLVKVINKESVFLGGLKNRAELLQNSSLKRELNFRTYLLIRVFFDAIIPAFVFGVGGYLYLSGQISIGNIVASLLLVPSITKPINNFTGYYLTLKDFIPRIKRINEIAKLKPKPSEKRFEKDIPDYENIRIMFSNVDFEEEDQFILNNVSFEIVEGQHVMISGESGSGKSTIINLLLGLYQPSRGQIKVNNIDFNQIDQQNYPLFSIAPQDAFFLDDTILNNLKSINSNPSEGDIKRALQLSCCEKFISELPDGIHTNIGENGNKLSGGQLQRLSIARALLANRKFLLLDESTSALNVELEREVLENLYKLEDVTIIQINHRSGYEKHSAKHIHIENQTITLPI